MDEVKTEASNKEPVMNPREEYDALTQATKEWVMRGQHHREHKNTKHLLTNKEKARRNKGNNKKHGRHSN